MEKIIYIYNNNLELVAQPYVTSYEEFKTNPKTFILIGSQNTMLL